jgi:hypothetical protein
LFVCEEFLRTLKQKVMAFFQEPLLAKKLGALPPTGNEENEQGMASSLITRNPKSSERSHLQGKSCFWKE